MIKFLTIPQKNLSKSVTSASTTFKLSNIKSWKTNALGQKVDLVAGDFGTQAYGAFRNDTGTILEIFSFDPATIADANISFVKRGLDFNGDITTETASYKLDFPAGTVVHLGTDIPQLFSFVPQISSGAVAPASTPSKVGDIYVDTVAKKLYFATGASSSADWTIAN